jgi:hypothetical protein
VAGWGLGAAHKEAGASRHDAAGAPTVHAVPLPLDTLWLPQSPPHRPRCSPQDKCFEIRGAPATRPAAVGEENLVLQGHWLAGGWGQWGSAHAKVRH